MRAYLLRLLVPLLIGLGLMTGAALWPVTPNEPPETRRPGLSGLALDDKDRTRLTAGIETAQQRLRRLPNDWSTWAQLGSAYVQQARVTADPSYYPKAEKALRRSLALRTEGNWQAKVGMGALANARHDFRSARDWGRQAERINPYAGSVHGVLADAFTEFGDYPAAEDAVQRMLDVQPGVASFARASYHFEQRGQTRRARTALVRALEDATDPSDVAFCRYHLGELAFNAGDLEEAVTQYQRGIEADPEYHLLYGGLAKAHAAEGETRLALQEYERASQRLPLPDLLAEYGDVLTAAGRHGEAKKQYDLVAAQYRLLDNNGGSDRLASAVFLADHGRPREALADARAEWRVRRSVQVADALAWALHRNGRDAEALRYSIAATRLGWRNATFYYHRGVIHHALGNRDQARRDLTDALAVNPHFDVLAAPRAQRLLSQLQGER